MRYFLPSFPRKRESSGFENKWIPARARSAGLAGMTAAYAKKARYTPIALPLANFGFVMLAARGGEGNRLAPADAARRGRDSIRVEHPLDFLSVVGLGQ